MTPTLTFLGAAGTVTGAKFLLESDGARVLLECGMFQGLRALRARNWGPPPLDPGRLDAVLLSHAHIDHSGYLPKLVRDGFRGPTFCSPGTADLLRIMLPDAARLQEEEAEYRSERALELLRPTPFAPPARHDVVRPRRARRGGGAPRGGRDPARLALRGRRRRRTH